MRSGRRDGLRGAAGRLAGAALCLTLGLALGACGHIPFLKDGGGPAGAKGPDYSRWDSYLGTASSQFSSLDQVNKANVGQLQVAWTYPLESGATSFNPLVVGEVMYVQAHGSAIVALEAATGKELWRRPNQGQIGGRGISYWQSEDGKDRRLLYINNGLLRAISADTGEPVPGFGGESGGVDLRIGLDIDISKLRPLQTSNPGRVFENLIIISLHTGAYDYASSPADIHAYDVLTGKLVWTFHVVPKKGEFGSDTWPDTDREKYGGGHNWSESTIDAEAGVIYIPTGTARFDFYGGNRAGDNLFANSTLALDARTGKRLWHFQTIHHDLWDFDLATAPKLMTIVRDGKKVPIVIQPTKHGFLFVFDRRTGKPIWPIEERPVPASDVPGEKASPTQPFPTWPKPYARQSMTEADINPHIPEADRAKVLEQFRAYRNEGIFTPPSLRGTISMPGHQGGANWGGAAIDPVRGRLFVRSRNLPTVLKLDPDPRPQVAAGMPGIGGDVQPYRSPVDFWLQSNSLSAYRPPWTTLTAYDMNSGEILWQVPDGGVMPLAEKGVTETGSHAPRGGPAVTAGGLIFITTSSDRKLRARDEETGRTVWEYDLPAAADGVPAIYAAGGRQFIVIPVGGNGNFANQLGLPKPGQSQYMAFALPQGASGGGQ